METAEWFGCISCCREEDNREHRNLRDKAPLSSKLYRETHDDGDEPPVSARL